jgi:hypothetical protein
MTPPRGRFILAGSFPCENTNNGVKVTGCAEANAPASSRALTIELESFKGNELEQLAFQF